MSIYRDKVYSVYNDVHATRTTKDTANQAREPGAIADAHEEQYRHLRKAAPANVPLPRTLTWAASLPPTLRPQALLGQYPRIANVIAATWGDSKAFSEYMQSLVTDTRGNRKGFPADVLRELGALALQRSQSDFARRQPRDPRS